MEQLAAFSSARRSALADILDRARARGEIAATAKLDDVVDQAFGLLWYRMIFAHHPVDDGAADDVAAALATQLGASQEA